MSVCDHHGVQVHPDEYRGTLVVHIGTATGRTTTDDASARLGITPHEYRQAVAELVHLGVLVRRPDGEYDVPDGETA